MNFQQRAKDTQTSSKTNAAHPLDRLDKHYLCDRLTVFTPSAPQVKELMALARRDLPELTHSAVIQRVVTGNPDCFWAIRRRGPNAASDSSPRGFVAFLMLNEDGAEALIRGQLDASDPPEHLLAGQHEEPAAIYVWALYAKGMLAPALSLVMEKLHTPLYRHADLFAKSVTKEGSNFLKSLGFLKGAWHRGTFHNRLYHYRREASVDAHNAGAPAAKAEWRPAYDSHRENADARQGSKAQLGVTVVHDIEKLMRVLSIRSAVYVGEQVCPYDEEYDGNDFCATHLLGYVGNEPAGCLRIRYFAGFAKLERLAVRQEYRRLGLGSLIVEAGIEFCRVKGYRSFYAQAQDQSLHFWKKLGFDELGDSTPFAFSDFRYTEIIMNEAKPSEGFSVGIDPYVLIRPEGHWDRPGVLEKSAGRTETSPARSMIHV